MLCPTVYVPRPYPRVRSEDAIELPDPSEGLPPLVTSVRSFCDWVVSQVPTPFTGNHRRYPLLIYVRSLYYLTIKVRILPYDIKEGIYVHLHVIISYFVKFSTALWSLLDLWVVVL